MPARDRSKDTGTGRGPRSVRSVAVPYAWSLAITGLAILLRWAMDPILGNNFPLATVFGAVAVAVWVGGAGPGLLAAVLGFMGCHTLFAEPRGEIWLRSATVWGGLAVFLLSSAAIIAFGVSMRRSRRHAFESRARAEREIEERRRIQRALHHSRESLRIVVDTMSAPVTRCGRDLRYLWVSRPYAAWLGRPPKEIVGRPILEIIGEEAFRSLLPKFDRVLSGEVVRYEELVPFEGIGDRWVQAVYTPTRDASGAVDGWVAVVLDIHDVKTAEARLRESDRRKDVFLATLAHELRNPLAPIANAVQILRLKDPTTPELRAARDIIDRQVRQMTHLVDDLLDISRITRGTLRLRQERIALEPVLESAVETVTPLIEAKGHTLGTTLPAEPVHLEADSTRLGQIVSNLLHNAANYTEPGGLIAIRVAREGDEVSISIRDTGVGIAPEHLPRVFDMFSQTSPALERSAGGLGIGLSLVRGLVELHGGRVEARSEGIGAGSEFVVRLPALLEVGPGIAETPKTAPERPASLPRRVLIVDDNADSTESLGLMLRLQGHETRTASNGEEAIAVARAFRPHVILLDVGMPLLNGLDAARIIRREPWGRNTVLVALTGWGQEEDKRRAFEAGFDHHLTKPADPGAIERIVTTTKVRPGSEPRVGAAPA